MENEYTNTDPMTKEEGREILNNFISSKFAILLLMYSDEVVEKTFASFTKEKLNEKIDPNKDLFGELDRIIDEEINIQKKIYEEDPPKGLLRTKLEKEADEAFDNILNDRNIPTFHLPIKIASS